MHRQCHYCGQELPEHRLGVRFTPLQGRIFDLVLNAGQAGISNDDLRDILAISGNSLSVNIHSINDRLVDTGYQIIGRAVRCLGKFAASEKRKLEKTGGRYHESDALTPEQQKALGL